MDSTLLFSTTARTFVLYNCTVLRHKTATKLLIYTVFVFWFDSNNKLNDLILLEKADVTLMTFLVKRQILYGTF